MTAILTVDDSASIRQAIKIALSGEGYAVTEAECEQVFFGRPLLVLADVAHSQDEPRFLALGRTSLGRLLFVVFTLRESLVRVISARPMSRREREVYQHAEAEEEDPSPQD